MVEPAAYTMFEIAAGTGMLGRGVSIALESLGIRNDVVGGCEWESCAAAAFLAGVENEAGRRPAVWDDARSFVGRRYRCPGAGSGVDIICAGYPCQPFSAAGRRAGAKDARHLWPAVRRIVARLKPGLVFFENVDGHVSLGLWKVLRDCERLGYRVTCGVFSSEEVGAPHLRKRVFILGVVDSIGGDGQPSGRNGQPDGCDEELADGIGERLEGGRAAGPQADERKAIDWRDRTLADGQCRPIFPPGRDDFRRWAELAAGGLDPSFMPAIESGVPVVADGMASSSDLLRLGGNGVDPVCAAWAFINLFACLMEDGGGESGTLFD